MCVQGVLTPECTFFSFLKKLKAGGTKKGKLILSLCVIYSSETPPSQDAVFFKNDDFLRFGPCRKYSLFVLFSLYLYFPSHGCRELQTSTFMTSDSLPAGYFHLQKMVASFLLNFIQESEE